MKHLEITVRGMHCEGCAKTLLAALSWRDGVANARVSFERGLATVWFDERRTSADTLRQAVADAGFEAAPEADAGAEAHGRRR